VKADSNTYKEDALFIYDFGDGWDVKIRLEKILPRIRGKISYLHCRKKSGCPWRRRGDGGYEEMLEILKDPSQSEYEDAIEWLGEDFDPEYFDPEDISFKTIFLVNALLPYFFHFP
jgi:hypothetical protein